MSILLRKVYSFEGPLLKCQIYINVMQLSSQGLFLKKEPRRRYIVTFHSICLLKISHTLY